MNTNEEENIELEQIIKETELKLKELSENELTKVNGGTGNGIAFEKGKWIRLDGTEGPRSDTVYELLELKDDEVITDMWIKIRAGAYEYKGKCIRNKSIPTAVLSISREITKPDWAHE